MIALALTAAMAMPAAPAKKPQPCQTRRCKARVAHKQCSNRRPRQCVWHVIHHQRIEGWKRSWLLRIPQCESTWNPSATNGAHVGLYQFRVAAPSTWSTTPYARRSPREARWQAYAAAWMLKQGRVGEWACR